MSPGILQLDHGRNEAKLDECSRAAVRPPSWFQESEIRPWTIETTYVAERGEISRADDELDGIDAFPKL